MKNISDVLTDEMIETFQKTGAVLVPDVLSSEMLKWLDSDLPQIADASDDYSDYYESGEVETTNASSEKRAHKKGVTLTRQNAWVISPALRRVLHESLLAEIAAKAMNSKEVRVYEDIMIYKAAGAEMPTPWHQDDPQWPMTGSQMCSAWFCMDPVDSKTGALRFVAGSHKGPRYRPYVSASRQADFEADSEYFEGGAFPDVDADPEKYPTICYDTKPGDIVLFHPRCIHGAFGSNPGYPRRTFSIRFLGDNVHWEPKKTVMYDWLANINLQPGQSIEDDHFPLVWPSQSEEPVPFAS